MKELQPGLEVELVEHADRDAFRAWWFKQREVSPCAGADGRGESPAAQGLAGRGE
jgi:hypothetical protein